MTGPSKQSIRAAKMLASAHTTRRTRKKHGGFAYFENDRISIQLDTYVSNLSVCIATIEQPDPSKGRCVLTLLYHGAVQHYVPGPWEEYIMRLLDDLSRPEEVHVTAALAEEIREGTKPDADVILRQWGLR